MFEGLAFPVVKVRYAGPTDTKGSRWIATMRRDNERLFRATASYNHDLPSGADNALAAARVCYALALVDSNALGPVKRHVDDYVSVPGDLDSDTYVFTFVPAELLS